MDNQQHPITPPDELVREWRTQCSYHGNTDAITQAVACMAARWGDEQRLRAVCEWLAQETPEPYIAALRAAMRPKPPSLAEQGLAALDRLSSGSLSLCTNPVTDTHTIRAALERLQQLEQESNGN